MRFAAVALLATVAVGLAVLVPAATSERVVFSSTPNPPPLFELTGLAVAPAQTACTGGIVLNPDAERLRLTVEAPGGQDAVPMTVELTGAGYRSTRRLDDYPPVGARVELDIAPVPRTLVAAMCVTNDGARAIALGATTESRTASRTTTIVDGKATTADPTLQLIRRERRSFASMLPSLFERASAFKPAVVSVGLFWVLALLLVVGLPLGAALALAVEPGQRDAEAAELEQDQPAEDDGRVRAT